ncbi:MAG TPA: rod shape-determining protein MreD [Candidatus Saccharimonadales bacterium]|nr:rod shape-determining protein MreD [Candidatus Saccharimonadales bacterium]
MKRAIGAALMLGAALVQVTWAPRIEVLGAFPNLVLIAVVALTWTRGVRAGMAWACVGGLFLDLTAAGPLGPHALGLLTGAYLTGFWTRNLDRQSAVQIALAAAVSTAAYSLVLVGSDDTLGLPVPPLAIAAELTLAACAYNAVLMPPALALLRKARLTAAEAV